MPPFSFYGGNFFENAFFGGFGSSVLVSAFAVARGYYRELAGCEPDPNPGGEAVEKDPIRPAPQEKANNVGLVNCGGFFCEGQLLSRILNRVPMINATTGVHDSWLLDVSDNWLTVLNVPSMVPSFGLTFFALAAQGPTPAQMVRILADRGN